MSIFSTWERRGGTALKTAFINSEVTSTAKGDIVLQRHGVTLADVPCGDVAVILVRDPVTRFISAFNARLRRGRPRYNSSWSKRELLAFSRYRSATRLADALHRGKLSATWAMTSIKHVKDHQTRWFGSVDPIQRISEGKLFVGRQEHLDADVARLSEFLALPSPLVLPRDPVAANRSTETRSAPLSPHGVEAIRNWYRDDCSLLNTLFPNDYTGAEQ